MDELPIGFIPIRYTLPLPEDILPLPTEGPMAELIDQVGISDYQFQFDETSSAFVTKIEIQVLGELILDVPGLSGFAIAIGSDEGLFSITGTIELTSDHNVFSLQALSFELRLQSQFFKRLRKEGNTYVEVRTEDGEFEPYRIEIEGIDVSVESSGNISIYTSTEAPAIHLDPLMLGDTGLILDLDEVQVIAGNIPEYLRGRLSDSFKGIWIRAATILYYKPGNQFDPTFSFEEAAIGSGGFTGRIALGSSENANKELSELELDALLRNEATTDRPRDIYLVELEGMRAALQYFGVSFDQSIPVASRIAGYIYMPFASKWFRLEASLGGSNADFMLELGGAGDTGLISLDNEWFEIIADSIRYELKDEVHYAIINGSVKPKIGGFDWPTFKVDRLAISSEGDIELEGGWIDMPETFTLDFHAFKVNINQFGMGSEGDGDNERQWIGLSGGITLVEGIPLSASVEGLKFSWKAKGEPDLQVSLTGIAVHLEIPNTLVLDGAVSYREIGPEDDLAKRTGISGHIFTGSVTIDLQALRTEVNAELLIGEIKDATGRSFTAFYIVLSAELPTAIPLGATGTGIYALQGLFGLHVAPDRQLTDGNPEVWYEWYRRAVPGVSGSEYNVTKVAKWAPRFDNYAFGAGLTLGTQFDDGFSINVGALVVVLIPGPVIMIEGRANFLKPRSGNGKEAQGALYALAVFDGLAATFQLNIDVQYDLEDVVAIQGGMECFFDFNDASRWYINLGRKDPESKRIQVSLLAILRASFYLMLSNSGIQTGAMVGFDFRANYGPVELKLIARIVVEAAIFWSPLQFEGKLELYGELSLKIFGIGIALIIQALLEGKSPKPFWLHGLFRVALSLPFPLPSFDFQVELTLADDPTPPEPTFPFLTGVAMSHHKLAGTAWELLDPIEVDLGTLGTSISNFLESADFLEQQGSAEQKALIVPIDSRPILSFARPVSGWSQTLIEGALVPVESDRVDNWEFRYNLTNLILHKRSEAGLYEKEKEYALNDLESGVRFFALDQILPTPDAQQPKLQFWRQSPLDIMPRRIRESFLDDYPACEKTIKAKIYYVFWAYIADGMQYQPEFTHQNLKFSVDLPAITLPQVQLASLLTPKLTVKLPQATSSLQIFILDPRSLDGNTKKRFGIYRDYPISVQCTAYRKGRKVEKNFPLVGSSNSALLQITIDTEIDTFRLVHDNYDKLLIFSIQYKTLEEVTREQITTSNAGNHSDQEEQSGGLTLSPNSFYRLTIQTQIERRRIDESSHVPLSERSLTYFYYFRTGDGPSAQPKAAASAPQTGQAFDYTTSPINDLAIYVARTLPTNGAKSFYYGYDVALEFNEPYVTAMYQPQLKMQVRDRNQKSQETPKGTWFNTLLPLLPAGLLTWLAAEQAGGCLSSQTNPAPKVPSLRRSLPSTLKPERLYNIDIVLESNPNSSLYSFQFATSRFKNIQEHLQSGRKEGEYEIIRSLGWITDSDLSWIEAHQTKLEGLSRERQSLQTLNFEDIRNLPQISEQLTKTHAALDDLNKTSANYFTNFYETLGLTFRPLPPRLEFSEICINSTNNRFLLLESPEPIEWSRVVVKCRVADADIPVQVLWNDDQARAFLLQQGVGWFATGEYVFEFQYSNGRDCPDLAVITIDNEIVNSYSEILKVRLS